MNFKFLLVSLFIMNSTISFAAETNHLSFATNAWNQSDWMFVKRRDEPSRTQWMQRPDCVENDGKHTSMLLTQKFKGDCMVSATMSFLKDKAPSIVIATKISDGPDGNKYYDDHLEVVLWDKGVNVWTMHTVDGKQAWTQTAYGEFKLESNTPYKLEVRKKGKELRIKIAGHSFGYVEQSLPDEYYLGVTACEGVDRLYDFTTIDAHPAK